MDPQGQERRRYVELWLRNSQYDCQIGNVTCGLLLREPNSLKFSSFIRYPSARLLEINSHSLFSRWFSESGKLVQKLFGTVMDMVEDEENFVVVLIGKAGSLSNSRSLLTLHISASRRG